MRARLDRSTARVAAARARLAANPTHARPQRRFTTAMADHVEICALYDSTPGGQEELRTAIEASSDPNTRDVLTARLRDA